MKAWSSVVTAWVVLAGNAAGVAADPAASPGTPTQIQAAVAAGRLVVGERIEQTDDGVQVAWQGRTTLLKQNVSKPVAVTINLPSIQDPQLKAFDASFPADYTRASRARDYDQLVALEKKLTAQAPLYLQTCRGNARFRAWLVQCLGSQASATSGNHTFDQRAIQTLTRALRIDPCSEWHIKALHWWTYHVHEADSNQFPEEEPDAQLRQKIVARQRQLAAQLKAQRDTWDKSLADIAQRPIGERPVRIRQLVQSIQQFSAPNDLWTLHVIRDSQENPNTYLGRCRLLLAECAVDACTFTRQDLQQLAAQAIGAIELLPADFDQAARAEWIEAFALKGIDLLNSVKKGEIVLEAEPAPGNP